MKPSERIEEIIEEYRGKKEFNRTVLSHYSDPKAKLDNWFLSAIIDYFDEQHTKEVK